MRDNDEQRSRYRRTRLVHWLGFVWMAALLAGCGGGAQPPVELGSVLDSQWKARYAGSPGGLTAVLITPAGEYFATTVAGTTPATHFRAASTTKTFTAAAIMLLDQRGQLKIDDVLTTAMPGGSGKPYLPATAGFAIPYKSQITIRQLLQHRAGVFDVANTDIPAGAPAPYAGRRYVVWVMDTQDGDHTFTLDEMIGVVATNQLAAHQPGTAFHYSDTGYSVLAKIVEQVSGKSFARFVQEELLLPNDLADTTFPERGTLQTLPAPFIPGTLRLGGIDTPVTIQNVSAGIGEGNVVSTPADLSRWFRRLLRGEAGVDATQVARMGVCVATGNAMGAYGLGLECHPTAFGHGHNGGNPGYLTVARHDVNANVTVVLLSTLADYDHGAATTEWLYDTVAKLRAAAGY